MQKIIILITVISVLVVGIAALTIGLDRQSFSDTQSWPDGVRPTPTVTPTPTVYKDIPGANKGPTPTEHP